MGGTFYGQQGTIRLIHSFIINYLTGIIASVLWGELCYVEVWSDLSFQQLAVSVPAIGEGRGPSGLTCQIDW